MKPKLIPLTITPIPQCRYQELEEEKKTHTHIQRKIRLKLHEDLKTPPLLRLSAVYPRAGKYEKENEKGEKRIPP